MTDQNTLEPVGLEEVREAIRRQGERSVEEQRAADEVEKKDREDEPPTAHVIDLMQALKESLDD